MARGVFLSQVGIGILAASLLGGLLTMSGATAADDAPFSLQVSPSPLVATVKPGEKKQLELKIRNASTSDEQLKIEARSFTFDNTNGTVALDDTTAPMIAEWVTLPEPGFTVKAGQWSTQQVTINLPKETGFSYSFALVITRSADKATIQNGQLLKGSVAVFTLINVDRPDAKRAVELAAITTDQNIYEFLPATISIRLKNTGNTIIQPYGNLFVQRPANNDNPIATFPINDAKAYFLPGTERSLHTVWSEGFPHYQQSTDASGNQKTDLEWNLEQIRHFRFGKYTARVVAVYNDGTRDVPIIGEVSFWVIPWKTMLIVLAGIIGIVLLFRYYIKKRTERAVKKALEAQGVKKE